MKTKLLEDFRGMPDALTYIPAPTTKAKWDITSKQKRKQGPVDDCVWNPRAEMKVLHTMDARSSGCAVSTRNVHVKI